MHVYNMIFDFKTLTQAYRRIVISGVLLFAFMFVWSSGLAQIGCGHPNVICHYLFTASCEVQSTYCCCEGGTSRVCNLPGTKFTCQSGGPFECDWFLQNCGENPSLCYLCCPPCGGAVAGGDVSNPDCPHCPIPFKAT